MTCAPLVLSCFPGIGLLDRAFELEGFTVVRGPDPLWGGDIRAFRAMPGRFDGVIGGPPCKGESNLAHLNGTPGASMRGEFCRVVTEAAPDWWLMEAVKAHEQLPVAGPLHRVRLTPRWFGCEQSRTRYFHSNLPIHRYVQCEPLEPVEWKHAVLAGHGGSVGSVVKGIAKYTLDEACRLQGLPESFHEALPFRREMKYEVIGNGVPLSMGRAVAKAVKRAMGYDLEERTA